MRASGLGLLSRGLHRDVLVERRAAAVAAVVTCLAASAYVKIPLPFTPVPITLQTFFVLVGGAALGPRLGTLAPLVYLLLGALGLPVFTAAWLGATAGYLVGFVAAGWLVGALTRAARPSTVRVVVAMAAGSVVIYLFGAAWLAHVFRLGVREALAMGVAPFVVGDAIKLAAAAALCRSCRGRLRVLFP